MKSKLCCDSRVIDIDVTVGVENHPYVRKGEARESCLR